MRVTIIRDDSVVGVEGVFRQVDLSTLPEGIRAVQWNGGGGHIEYDQGANTTLYDLAAFQPFVMHSDLGPTNRRRCLEKGHDGTGWDEGRDG